MKVREELPVKKENRKGIATIIVTVSEVLAVAQSISKGPPWQCYSSMHQFLLPYIPF